MNQNEMTPAVLTVLEVSELLGVCDTCGETPALSEPGGNLYVCASCHALDLLTAAARDHFRELLTPILGVWADHWNAAGVPPGELAEILEIESGAWMYLEAGQQHRAEIIRELLEHHRPPAYRNAEPERVTVTLEQLPTLAGYVGADAARGLPRHYFTVQSADGTAGTYQEAPGLDMLTLEMPDGSAVLLPLGYKGRLALPTELPRAVRIPTHLREQARAVYLRWPRANAEPEGSQS